MAQQGVNSPNGTVSSLDVQVRVRLANFTTLCVAGAMRRVTIRPTCFGCFHDGYVPKLTPSLE